MTIPLLLFRAAPFITLLLPIAGGAGEARSVQMPASGRVITPATFRIAQVVPQLPLIHVFATAHNSGREPLTLPPDKVSAQMGTRILPVQADSDDRVAVIFLVDISKSLSADQFQVIRNSLLAWIDSLRDGDLAAIVSFGSTVETVQNYTADHGALKRTVLQLGPRDDRTFLYQGLVESIDLARRLDDKLPLRRVIVTLTDGIDDQQGGADRNEVVDKLRVDPVPIYGFGAAASKSAVVDQALKSFSSVVRLSGGDFRRIDLANPAPEYLALRRTVGATMHFTIACVDCDPNGEVTSFRLLYAQAPTRLTTQSIAATLVDGKPGQHRKEAVSGEPEAWWWRLLDAISRMVSFNITATITIALGTLTAAGAATAYVAQQRKATRSPEREQESSVTHDAVFVHVEAIYGVAIAPALSITPGSHRDRQRLRLYPLGKNTLQPMDLLFERPLTLGRDPGCDIRIDNDGQVSSQHCTLSVRGDKILVEDNGSLNHTRINGVDIGRQIHVETDSILGVGRTELRIRLLRKGMA